MIATDRRFGVEIEASFQDVDGTHDAHYRRCSELLKAAKFPLKWRKDIGIDGSGFELRSPILCGTAGMKELERIYDFLNQHGVRCTPVDGAHVHHDAPDFIKDRQLVHRLAVGWHKNRDIIQLFVAPRRWESTACEKFPDHYIGKQGAIETWAQRTYGIRSAISVRNDLNLRALAQHGSIEVRLLEGTMDFKKIKAWILFGQYFLHKATRLKRPIAKCKSPEELLHRITLSEERAYPLLDCAYEVNQFSGELDEDREPVNVSTGPELNAHTRAFLNQIFTPAPTARRFVHVLSEPAINDFHTALVESLQQHQPPIYDES